MLKGKKIILGISGSIAAYKAVFLLRLLKKAEAEVKIVTTPAVTRFVGELSLSSLSGKSVFSGIWDEKWSEHVSLGTWADLMVVAPATANTLAKFAHGLCDNALTAVFLAARCPVMIAPAMDADMYIHPRTQANLEILKQDGCEVLGTGTGFLASGLEGPGRLLEPEEIFAFIERYFEPKLLSGKKLLVTAGPTQEAIDPVRYISNHSSGKMGYALASVGRAMGAAVTLVSGPTSLKPPAEVVFRQVSTAKQMFKAVTAISSEQDIIIMAAAVADYTPKKVAKHKIKKKDGEMTIELSRTPDILQYLGDHKPKGQLLIGFAMETQHALENAQKKLHTKKLDFIVLNSLNEAGAGFGHDTNRVTILDKNGGKEDFPIKPKMEVAKDIFEKIISLAT